MANEKTTKKTATTSATNTTLKKAVDIPKDDLMRDFLRQSPKEVDGIHNASVLYYKNWALKKILSRFYLENCPTEWDIQYFFSHLFLDGIISIIDTDLGVIPLKCGVSGINVWDRPTDIIIANHVVGSFTRKIGEDGALIHLQYDYKGIFPLLNRYGELLASCDSALAVNLMNSKVAFIGMVDDKTQAATMQKMYDTISGGSPAVFVRKNAVNPENFILMNVKQTFVADDIMLVKRKLVNDFLSDIGINNANLDKRERLNSDEVNANNEEVRFNVLNWLDCIESGLEVANRLYKMDLHIRLREVTTETERDIVTEIGTDELTKSNKLSK